MRIGISNLAWPVAQDAWVAEQLVAAGLCHVDLAPTKYFGPAWAPKVAQAEAVRRFWEDRGLPIVGLQSLLFGSTGLNVFGSADVQAAMLAHLGRVAEVAALLGASKLVFGSPRNRDATGLAPEAADAMAADFFRRVGDLLAPRGQMLCLEPNPPVFGGNFMLDTPSTLRVVQLANHPAVKLNFDTGALLTNDEQPDATLAAAGAGQGAMGWVGHVHLSEPRVLPLGESGRDHRAVAQALRAWLPDTAATVEVLEQPDRPVQDWLPRALAFAVATYG